MATPLGTMQKTSANTESTNNPYETPYPLNVNSFVPYALQQHQQLQLLQQQRQQQLIQQQQNQQAELIRHQQNRLRFHQQSQPIISSMNDFANQNNNEDEDVFLLFFL